MGKISVMSDVAGGSVLNEVKLPGEAASVDPAAYPLAPHHPG
jgi:hypothetical protein